MKSILLALSVLVASVASAAEPAKQVAHCTISESGKPAGTLLVSHYDNGDEGLLTFDFKLPEISGRFTDNIQDDGVAFLKRGARKLYVPLEGIQTTSDRALQASVYLENTAQGIRGVIRIDFTEARLACKAD